jgi:chromosome partitioning protein
MEKPFIIAICHQKGGVAKTTTALSLGACFAEQRLSTLLIDLDPSANLTSGAGLAPNKVRKSAADILLGNDPVSRVVQATCLPGMDLIPSNLDMAAASRFLSLRPRYESLLHTCITQNDSSHYEMVLIDCPPSLGPLAITALGAAHLALIPIQCEFYSLQALDGLFGAIRSTRARTNPQLAYRLVITMFDRRGSLHSRVLQLIQDQLPGALCETIIGFDSKVRESQLSGRPVPIHSPKTRAAQQYRCLASEIYAYVETQTEPQYPAPQPA